MTTPQKLLISIIAVLLSACATSSVLVGTTREAIEPDQVKIYLKAPEKYEEVALLEASDTGAFTLTSQGRTNKVIERLKEEAAELGANGVILQGVDSEFVGRPTQMTSKVGKAIAIYVPLE